MKQILSKIIKNIEVQNFLYFLECIISRNLRKRITLEIMKQLSKKEQIAFYSCEEYPNKGRYVAKAFLDLSKRYMGKKILEIGGGDGSFYNVFKHKYRNTKELISIDIVPKSRLVKKGDCTNLNFVNKSFDTVVSEDVIEHLNDEDLNKTLNEINRVIKIRGFVIINTINNENLNLNTIKCPECGCKFHRVGHCQVFNENRIRNLFKCKGFKIIELRNLNFSYYARSKFISTLIYSLKLENLLDDAHYDLFFVAKKVRDL